jgi:hypothetical protein
MLRWLAFVLTLALALPATAQDASKGNPVSSNANCPDTGNAVNQAQQQNCADGKQNSVPHTTSKGGNSGQQRHPGVNR